MQSKNCKKEIPTLDTRTRAIFCCIWFGTMPWQLYESEKHYEYDYYSHLKLNWGSAWMWLTSRKIDKEELEFEHEVNPSWPSAFNTTCPGLRR